MDIKRDGATLYELDGDRNRWSALVQVCPPLHAEKPELAENIAKLLELAPEMAAVIQQHCKDCGALFCGVCPFAETAGKLTPILATLEATDDPQK